MIFRAQDRQGGAFPIYGLPPLQAALADNKEGAVAKIDFAGQPSIKVRNGGRNHDLFAVSSAKLLSPFLQNAILQHILFLLPEKMCAFCALISEMLDTSAGILKTKQERSMTMYVLADVEWAENDQGQIQKRVVCAKS